MGRAQNRRETNTAILEYYTTVMQRAQKRAVTSDKLTTRTLPRC